PGFVQEAVALEDIKPGWTVSVTTKHDGDREVAIVVKVLVERRVPWVTNRDRERSVHAREGAASATAIRHEAQHALAVAPHQHDDAVAMRALVSHAPGADDGDCAVERTVLAAVEVQRPLIGAIFLDRHRRGRIGELERQPTVPVTRELLDGSQGVLPR